MTEKEIALLISSAISLVELIVRLKAQMPEAFESEEAAIEALKVAVGQLEQKPADYLQNWEPGKA